MPTLTALLLAVADLTEAEPRPEALATAAALRAAAGADFPPQIATALARRSDPERLPFRICTNIPLDVRRF